MFKANIKYLVNPEGKKTCTKPSLWSATNQTYAEAPRIDRSRKNGSNHLREHIYHLTKSAVISSLMSSSTSQQVNEDWRNREVLEIVQLNMLKIVAFVNKFDASARAKLSELNEKMTQLERSLQMAEAAHMAEVSIYEDDER
jgi:hypothetical protein